MQQDEESQNWQQPQPVAPGAPYESVPDEVPTLSDDTVQPQVSSDVETDDNAPEQPISAEEDYSEESDETLIQWQATEYVSHDRSARWFAILAVLTLVLIAIALFVMRSVTFAILVPVMAVALVIYVRRPPAILDYIVSRKGIHLNDRLYAYSEFRSFGVLSHDNVHSIVLVPRKRFQLSQTMYFPEEVGESLVDMLAARLPMQDVKLDAIDTFLARLHL